MSAFESFVNLELPRRSALLTVAITGYDGDPNAPAAPAALQGAPTGTWYLRETPSRSYYRKTNSGATDWANQTPGVPVETMENLTVTVDYNDVTAVDPPTGTIFSTQQQIDDVLTASGTTTFKHLAAVWRSFAPLVRHAITINMAAGVHRPETTSTTWSWDLSTLSDQGGSITIQGNSTYDELVASQTITGVQLDSGDPWIDVAGTPFAGLDLHGVYAVLSTGQKVMIHDHTDSRLFVLDPLSPNPTGGTVTVGEPSTKLRNSLDDVATKNGSTLRISWPSINNSSLNLNDVLIDPFGNSSNAFTLNSSGRCRFQRVIIDNLSMVAAFGKTPNGNNLLVSPDAVLAFVLGSGGSVRAPRPAAGNADSIIVNGTLNMNSTYVGGSEDGFFINLLGIFTLARSVVEQCSILNQTIKVDGGRFQGNVILTGKRTEIRGCTVPVIRLLNGARFVDNGGAIPLVFKNNTAACIVLENNATLDLSTTTNVLDGGGNGDVGIEIQPSFNTVKLSTAVNLTGTNGDVRLEGTIGPYGDLPTIASSLFTAKGNSIGRG